MTSEVPASGRLRDARLPVILTRIQRAKRTGVLVLNRNDQRKSIFIKDGDIIFAASRYQDDWLGEFLLKLGKITLKQYEAASAVTRATKKRLGAVLVEQGVLVPKDLYASVTQQVKEIILSLFTWIDGEYQFEEGALPSQEVITLKMSTANMILEGIRRITDFTRLRGELPSMDSVLQVTADPLVLFQDMKLSETERSVLALFDGRKTLLDVFEASSLPAFDTLKLIHFFHSVGLVEPSTGGRGPEAPDRPRTRAAESSKKQSSDGPSGRSEAGGAKAPGAGPKETLREAVHDPGPSAREESGPRDAGAIKEKIKKIQGAFESIGRLNYYEILGVSREAGRDEIKRAYFRLAKEYHPDRHFEAGMDSMTPMLEGLFRAITEAYDTLLMEGTRKEYDAEFTMKKFQGRKEEPAKGTANAAGFFSQGEQALKKGDLKAALYYFEAALKNTPDKGQYHAGLARALSRTHGKNRDAETHYKRAIELEPATVDYYLELGRLYKRSGMAQRALRQFEEALVWDPENASAKAEIKDLLAS